MPNLISSKLNHGERVGLSQRKGDESMWLEIWAVTLAIAVGCTVMALVIRHESDGATLGR